jgi:hypothetical protein
MPFSILLQDSHNREEVMTMNLKNERYANSTLISAYGELKFDAQGILQTELDEQAVAALSKLKGFEKVEVNPPKAPAKEVEDEKDGGPKDEEEKPKSKRGAHLNQHRKQ